jgi:hypothetical protein
MKLSGRYSFGLGAGVSGFLLLILINAFSIPDSLKQASEKDAYRTQAALEKARLQAQIGIDQEKAKLTKQRADTYAENEVQPFKSFSIWGYVDNPSKQPVIDFRAFPDPSQRVYIFDSANKCIGYVEQGGFYWKHQPGSENICTEIQQ